MYFCKETAFISLKCEAKNIPNMINLQDKPYHYVTGKSLNTIFKVNDMSLSFTDMPSPVGHLRLIANPHALVAILWENDAPKRVRLTDMQSDCTHPVLIQAKSQLTEFFEGKRQTFNVPLEFHGTEFQKAVWHALLTIPFGQTRSYLDIATQIGNPKASRAVGAANGKNPISIIAPCHRVIGRNGSLTGFAGGLENKMKLLELENHQLFSVS